MCSALKEEESGSPGILRVGVAWEVSLHGIQPATRRFNARYPNLRVEVLCDHADNLIRDLHGQRADLAVLSGRPKATPADGRLIVTRLAASKRHRLFWIARRMQGQSLLANEFENELRGQSKNVSAAGSIEELAVRSPAVLQGTSPRPKVVPLRYHERGSHVAVLKLGRS
jgi:hypothetical protein